MKLPKLCLFYVTFYSALLSSAFIKCFDPHALDDLLQSRELEVKISKSSNASSTPSPSGRITWEHFKQKFGKNFSSAEEEERKAAFNKAQEFIEKHNQKHAQGLVHFKLKTNNLADIPFDKYRKRNNYKLNIKKKENGSRKKRYASDNSYQSRGDYEISGEIPEHVDWRDRGYVTDVKMQGSCGCCWAFSSVGALEAQYKKMTGRLLSFSEQQMVDCATEEPNDGCNGGNMDSAFAYVRRNGGLATEDAYRFEEQDENCRSSRDDKWKRAHVTGYRDLPQNDEQVLMQTVASIGPVSAIIDASHQSFQFYSEGVYDDPDCDPSNLDHGVLIVGYGRDPEYGDYWLVKNSWATDWGEDGYVRMARNRNNQCGIATSPSYPIVASGPPNIASMDNDYGGDGGNGNGHNFWGGNNQGDEPYNNNKMPSHDFDMPIFIDSSQIRDGGTNFFGGEEGEMIVMLD